MVARKAKKSSKKVQSLPARNVGAAKARGVKGGDKANPKPKPADFTFVHTYDKSSP